MNHSETLAALAADLALAQAEVEGAAKGRVNPAFKSKYADLASVWEACREALTSHGLSIIQSPGPISDGRMEMTTMLLHKSGEWVRGSLTIPLGKVDAQSYGSATTYARRYALAAFVGVAPEDDDGMAATKAKPAGSRVDPNSLASKKREGVFEELQSAIDGCETLDDLTAWVSAHADELKELPQMWRDGLRDRYALRREELNGAANIAEAEAELDEGFRATLGGQGSGGLSGNDGATSVGRGRVAA